jgi:RHS repeat-associated protein
VVKILSISAGLADVDTDGDGVADNGLGVTTSERSTLASLYAAGETLWRVPVVHFSPGDANWPYTIPADATAPGQSGAGPDPNEPLQDPHCSSGSIIDCENQVLGESIPIVGTPYTLNYRSDRVPGRVATRTIRLSGASVPASLASIGLHMSVAGRNFDQTFPAGPNQQTTFVWDRLDAYGRQVLGGQTLSVTIDYNYPTSYKDPGPLPNAFNSVGGVTLGANPTRQQVSISQSFTTTIGEGLTDARAVGLGGWTLSGHQVYDPIARVVHLGNGAQIRAGSLARTMTFVHIPGQSVLFDVEVGPDGSQYVALPHNCDCIIQISPDGSQKMVAGNGTEGFNGDGIPASEAELGDPTGIAIAPDGSMYIAEESNHRVRKVAPDGTISTIAGNGSPLFSGDGGPATQAGLLFPERVALASDGGIYILDANGRVRRVSPDGIINTVAGNGSLGFSGDGGPATVASISALSISAAPDGGFYIADFANQRVRRVDPGGTIETVVDYTSVSGRPVSVRPTRDGGLLIAVQFASARTPEVDLLQPNGTVVTVAGGGPSPIEQGIPATQADLGTSIEGVALSPDGTVYMVLGDSGDLVLRVSPALPGAEGTQVFIASPDGGQLYVFDATGKHLETLNALTGAVLFDFGYDANGHLSSVTEKTGGIDNVTTIEHDASGNPTKITGPFGQVTTLTVDGNGFVSAITDPAGGAIQLTSDGGGLLQSYTDPRGKTSTFTYDADGLLVKDADPLGGAQTLARATNGNQFVVTRTTTLGRVTTYSTANLPGNVQQRTITEPDGSQTQSVETFDAGTVHATSSDGMSVDTVLGPDPRFGMEAPVRKSVVIASPKGLSLATSSSLTALLASPTDPLSLSSLSEISTLNGRPTNGVYTASSRTLATTSPGGRTTTSTIDSLGRLVSTQLGSLEPTSVTYDSRGRLSTMTRGSGATGRTVTFNYDAAGFLQSTQDPLGRVTRFTRDAAGRILTKTFPDGRVASFGYDPAGNLTSITPPGRPSHTLAYSDRNELLELVPPAVAGTGPTDYGYDLDRAVTTMAQPNGATVTLAYDAFGRLATRTIASNGVVQPADSFAYDSAGRLSSIATGAGETTTFSYDGSLPVGKSWSGPVSGTVTRAYDATFRLATESVNAANTIAYSYDADDLLVAAGPLVIDRDPQTGFVTGTSLGVVNTSTTLSGLSEVTDYVASANGNTLLGESFVRDAAGRITQKTETIGGVTDTYAYGYTTAGDLASVAKNGVTAESYVYDSNGNRTKATVQGTTTAASYDEQDRLSQYGTAAYTFDASGALASKASGGQVSTYRYDALGNLLGATLPNGTTISYVVDGNGRRIGKKVNGSLVKGFLYSDQLRIVAELDGSGSLVSRFLYAGGGVPAAMVKGGVTFRIVTDQLGSVRLVVDSTNGAIVQRIDYDSFGNVTLDTNPGFQPFGFAGGLYDADTGLVRFGLRDYDPGVGRWTAKDPAGFAAGDGNMYRYVSNDPVDARDSTGLDAWDFVAGFSESVSAGAQMSNPVIALDVLVDSAVRWGAVKLGVDPTDPTFFGPTPPGYDHPPTLYEQLFHPASTIVDRASADYSHGATVGMCLVGAVDLAGGIGGIAGGLEAAGEALDTAAVARANNELAQQVADRAAQKAAQAAADARPKFPTIEVIKPDIGGAGTRAAGKAAGGIWTGR